MQIAARAGIAGMLVALSMTIGTVESAYAVACGDANRTGTVTVTDGVIVLRAAAELPALCPRERCDMNVDGNISVTDGVLALRVAAGVETSTACSASQVGTIFGQISKLSGLGGMAAPGSRARAAGGVTTPCPGGGFTAEDETVLEYFDCVQGDLVTTGTLEFEFQEPDTVHVFFFTTDLVLSTGELNDTSGVLAFTFLDDGRTQLNGILDHTSSLVGTYTDEFVEVFLDDDFQTRSGRVFTTFTAGIDFFANVASIVSTIYRPTLARIFVEYTDGDFDNFTFADGLCEPCNGGCSNPALACSPCVGQCVGATDRCGIDFEDLECVDGIFGPVGLCDACTSDADCNTAGGLSCFACDENCTGTTKRCGSSFAFVECGDGSY